MIVTIGIIAYNEEKNINDLFESILRQTYPHKKIEIVMADGLSTDKTKDIMLTFREKYLTEFYNIKVLDNPKRVQPAGWNVVIPNAEGDVIIRADAHGILNDDFVEQNVRCIESGEYVCGGKITKVIKNDKNILLIAENSMFGSGLAKYRTGTESQYVKTVAHACYRKEVFDKVGLFNEKLLRSEDNEMHYRIRKAGYKIRYDDSIRYDYQTRPSLKGMLKQKFGNGKYVGITTKISPKVFSLYHYVPGLFVLCALIALALFITAFCINNMFLTIPFVAGVGLYLLLDSVLSVLACKKNGMSSVFLKLLLLFPLLHFAYGVGTLIGFLMMPFVNVKNDLAKI